MSVLSFVSALRSKSGATTGPGTITTLATATIAIALVAVGANPSAAEPLHKPAATHHATSSPHVTASHNSRHVMTATQIFALRADKVISDAAKQKGKPYVYGDDGPHAFDCSGLVRYVFHMALGKNLPHNAAAQYGVSHHISRRQLRVGDLVFVDDGYISHVGIYDGHGYWWVAPHTGQRVQRQKIYAAHFVYGRVIDVHSAHYSDAHHSGTHHRSTHSSARR